MKRYIKSAITNPEDESMDVRFNMASDTNVRSEVLLRLVKDVDVLNDITMINAILHNPNTSPDVLFYILTHSVWAASVPIQLGIVKHPNVSEELLEMLSCSQDGKVLNAIGKNVKTPTKVLYKLASSPIDNARMGVAENPKAPADILLELSKDSDVAVLWQVGKNPSTPPHILETMLFTDDCRNVLDVVLHNPATSSQAIQEFIRKYSGSGAMSLHYLNLAKAELERRGEPLE